MQNSIKFEGYMIQKLNLEKKDDIKKDEKGNISLNCSSYQNKEKGREDSYKVSMNINLYTNLSKIELVIDGFFIISKKIDDEIKKNFLEISAPAILYPYARTLISNITAFDADETVLLPIINFAKKQ